MVILNENKNNVKKEVLLYSVINKINYHDSIKLAINLF